MILGPRYTAVRASKNACFTASVGVNSSSLPDVPAIRTLIRFSAKRRSQAQGDADSMAPLSAPQHSLLA
jgi:hypothetical protein